MSPALGSLVGLCAMAAAAPALCRWWGRNTGYPLAAGFAALTVWLGARAPAVLRGEVPDASAPWIPSLGIRFSVGLDGLSLVFALLVLGVGALVLAYSARYLSHRGTHGRFYGLLVLFAASMLGLVTARDIVLLFVFWELTSITSFFLIAGDGRPESSAPAGRALLVTGLGGLALFAGLVVVMTITGSSDINAVLGDPSSVRDHALAPAVISLLLLGAFTKSAQFPFHFWLPGAMVAPTPISTYLHAATMVKAGIYLLARFTPVFGGTPEWSRTIMFTGLVTAVIGAALALKQYDLKALLAYSTVSQLGFIVALVGIGTPHAIAAATIHTIAHASYKATLFMVTGIIDVEAGSRDIRRLSGLRRLMPWTAAVTGVSALSMAGIPPALGFVSKEEAFAAFLGAPGLGPVAAMIALAATVMTFAYGARILDGAFGGPVEQHRLFDPHPSFLAPAAVTAVAGIGLGTFVWVLDDVANQVVSAAGAAGTVHLALWHGPTAALGLSLVTVAGGLLLFAARRSLDRVTHAVELPADGSDLFDRSHSALVRIGEAAGALFLRRSPARHLAWVLAAAVAPVTGAWFYYGAATLPVPPTPPEDWAVLSLLVLAVGAAVTAHIRLAAVAVIGVAGFIVALVYVLLGAPDLALTQVLVETLTIVVVVLVFRRLPSTFRRVSGLRRAAAAAAALVVGGAAALGAHALTGRAELSDIASYYLEAAPAEAGGRNVVNTIIVDFRALDTFGEIVVLTAAALGVFALVRAVRART